jgi:hypothetical protein
MLGWTGGQDPVAYAQVLELTLGFPDSCALGVWAWGSGAVRPRRCWGERLTRGARG